MDPVLTSYYVTISIWCQTVVFIADTNTVAFNQPNTYLSLVNLEYFDFLVQNRKWKLSEFEIIL